MSIGFVVVRHVTSERTNQYWKESYRCIRNHYPDVPILLIDDSSDPTYLVEDIVLSRCTVIYDKDHRGCAELLPYYYFHLLKPFDMAIVLHDSVFLQGPYDFQLKEGEPYRGLWTFNNVSNHYLYPLIREVIQSLPHHAELMETYEHTDRWYGLFGVMSVIRWEFLDHVNREEDLFARWLPLVRDHGKRQAMERAMGVIFAYHHACVSREPRQGPFFWDIGTYTQWGTTFETYLANGSMGTFPLAKVWTGR